MARNDTQPASSAPGWGDYLPPDEAILWQGQPATGISWRGGEMGTVVLGALILAFIGFFLWDLWSSSDGSDAVFEGSVTGVLVFAVIGLALAASGPLGMEMVRRGTWYTLTNRRAIIAHWPTLYGVTVYRGLDCYPITEVAVMKSDVPGLLTAQFSRQSQRHTFVPGKGWRRNTLERRPSSNGSEFRDHPAGFERIADAGHVAGLCRRVQADPRHMDWLKGA